MGTCNDAHYVQTKEPKTLWEHVHWPKRLPLLSWAKFPRLIWHWTALLIDPVTSRSPSLTPPCVWAWRWIFWTQPSLNLSRTGLWQTRKFLPKTRWNLRWRVGGNFFGCSNVRTTSTTISPQKSRHKFRRWKTEFRHFPAVTKIKISPFPPEISPRPESALPLPCLSGPSPPHSTTDLHYLTLASPYRGLFTVSTVRTKLETCLILQVHSRKACS